MAARPGSAVWLLALCGGALAVLTVYALALPQPVQGQFGIGYGAALDRFVGVAGVQAAIYAGAVALVLRGGVSERALWPILGGAAILRVIAVSAPPFLSNDMYRYVWDGWVQAARINPYRYIPADPHLAFLRDAVVFPNINRADYAHTIYPPAAEMIFLAGTRLAAWAALPPVLGLKLVLLALEAVGILAMVRLLGLAGLPRARVLIYAWNPLPVWEFASSGHVDAIAVCFVALALLAAAGGGRGLAGAALAAATLTKFLPIVLFPALWRRWDWRLPAVFAGMIALLYAPYLGVGWRVFGFLGGYTAQEGIAGGQGLFLLGLLGQIVPLPAMAARFYLGLFALLLAALGTAVALRPLAPQQPAQARVIARNCLWLGCALTLGLSPHYPWYFCWLLVPACVVARPSAIYLATAAILLYLNPIHSRLFWPALVYGPFLILAAAEIWLARPQSIAPPIRQGDLA